MVKLDFGCGPNKREGFTGVDQYPFEGVDIVGDVTDPHFWNQFEDGSVDEAHASHFVEHLTALQRCLFFNQVYRILKAGGQIQVITPHWSSCRAYGDPTHQWPPVSEFTFYYLDKEWRKDNAPHTDGQNMQGGYTCDFTATWGYSMHPSLNVRNTEYQQFALNFYKEAAQDTIATLTKRG